MTGITSVGRFAAVVLVLSIPAAAQCNGGGGRGGGGGEIALPPPPPPRNPGPGDLVSASGPATPGPAGPATPGPSGPRSPGGYQKGPNTPFGGLATQPTAARRGAPITFSHRGTTFGELRLDWDYPTLVGDTGGPTVAPKVFAALPLDEAFALAAGDDPRPLLLLRECPTCQGSEKALIDVKNTNEKTLLFARWFHCVRVEDSVRHETHPFHNVFKENAWPHLILCERDGGTLNRLDGKRPQSVLWAGMRAVLKQTYTKDPDAAVRDLYKVLAQYDHLDSMEAEISARLQSVLEKEPKDSPRAVELEGERTAIVAKRDELKKTQAELMDLGLKAAPTVAATSR